MPTLLECLLELEELKLRAARAAGWGRDGDHDRQELEEFRRSLGEALLAVSDDIFRLVGDIEIPVRGRLPSLEERALSHCDPADRSYQKAMRTMPEALSAAVAEGASTIAVADEAGFSFRSRVGWAATRGKGTTVFVAPSEAIAEQTRYEIGRTEGASPTLVLSLGIAASVFADGGREGVATVYFLERHPPQDARAAKVAEDVRRFHPDATILFDTGYPHTRRIAEPDVVLRRPGGDAVIVERPVPASPRI